MLNRVKQFYFAILASKADEYEQQILGEFLPHDAIEAFTKMTVGDQRHSINVFCTAVEKTDEYDDDYDWMLLARCCFLHDIGRGHNMGTMKKTVAVLMNKMFHDWAVAKGRERKGFFGEMLYRYYHHGEIAGEMLRNMGLNREAAVIELHHKSRAELEKLSALGNWAAGSKELKLLQEADELN